MDGIFVVSGPVYTKAVLEGSPETPTTANMWLLVS